MKKVEVNGENFQKWLEITNNINALLLRIKEDTGGYSTHNHIFEHSDFKKLVEMGNRIIPYLFFLIREKGGSWTLFHLIHQITKENPVPKGEWSKFTIVMISWLQWYFDSKYYDTDVYFGLLD